MAHHYRWIWGIVARDAEHMQLLYGEEPNTLDDLIVVALVSRPVGSVFTVGFLVDEDGHEAAIRAVKAELDYYLVELKPRPDPWGYAIYHCSTASNLYGKVHWAYYPERTEP